MDLGIYLHSKKRMFLILLSPLLLSIILCIYTRAYGNQEKQVEWRKAFLERLPYLHQKRDRAQESVEHFLESYVSKVKPLPPLHKIAHQSAFILNEIHYKKDKSTESKIIKTHVDLQGEGSLVAMMEFLHQLYKLNPLFTVNSLKLNQLSTVSDMHQSDVNITWYHISP